jgi:Protein of unknown function (DUF2844)
VRQRIFLFHGGIEKLCPWAVVRFAAILTLLTATLPAFAALGEAASSVQVDQAHMRGVLRVTQTQAYTVHEIQAASGTVVREYVSSSGKVFAVAWQGPWPPDMRQILAGFFEPYQQAVRAQTHFRGRQPLRIEQPGFVVHSGGHMRSFAGHAYIPEMLPQGVTPEEIR